MNKILFFSLFLFSITFSFSQQYSKIIQWNKPISIENGENSYLAPNFEDVHYDNGIPKVYLKKAYKGSNLKVGSVSLTTSNALQSEINYLSLMNVRIAEINPLDIKFTKAAHDVFLVVS